MSLRKKKPSTPSNRFTVLSDFSELTTRKPEKSLVQPLRKKGGRGKGKKKDSKKSKGKPAVTEESEQFKPGEAAPVPEEVEDADEDTTSGEFDF